MSTGIWIILSQLLSWPTLAGAVQVLFLDLDSDI